MSITIRNDRQYIRFSAFIYTLKVIGVCYAAYTAVYAFGQTDGGNREPESVIQHLAFLVAAGVGSMFGAAALVNTKIAGRSTWKSVRSVWIVSTMYGTGFCPLIFWYFDWPYRNDRVFTVAFSTALLSDMLSTTLPPILRAVLPSIVSAVLRIRAADDVKPARQERDDKPVDSDRDGG